MRVVLGPLPSASVLSWIAYAREVVATAEADPDGLGAPLGPDLVEGFRRYLDDWDATARRTREFRWSTEIDGAMAEYLLHGFHRVVERLAKEAEAAGNSPGAPSEGDEFYHALVSGLLDGLAEDDSAGAEFADHLRSFWPGLPERS
ncbi:hypothetical protein BH24ACT3_BH24ACT3_11040 [soil metagenome]